MRRANVFLATAALLLCVAAPASAQVMGSSDEYLPPGGTYDAPSGTSDSFSTPGSGLGPNQTITRFRMGNYTLNGSGYTMGPLTPTTNSMTFTGEADMTINGSDYTADVTGGTATITGPPSGDT